MKSIKETYRQFLNTDYGARLYNSFKLLLYGEEDSLAQALNTKILQYLPFRPDTSLDVCDIGGGDGKRISYILRYLHFKFALRFWFDLVEQSRQYIDAFDAAPLNGFCETTRFHDLFENVTLHKHYDLVFLIHSIFAFENGNAIGKVLSLPRADGTIVVVSNAPTSFLGGLKRLVDEGYSDNRYEIDQLECSLQRQGIPFSKIEFQTKWVVEKSRYQPDINTLLEWITLGTHSTFTSTKKNLVRQYIFDNSLQKDQLRYFSEDEVVLLIPPHKDCLENEKR